MPTHKHINTILFDLDGTLVDTAPDLTHALNQLLVRRGQPPIDVSVVRNTITFGSPKMLEVALGVTMLDPDYHTIRQEFIEEYQNTQHQKTTLYAGMERVLKKLADMNIQWGVVSNKSHDLVHDVVHAVEIDHRCAILIGASEQRQSKPEPDALIYACEQLNVSYDQCVYIGDAATDIQAAKKINMYNIAAMYGYVPDSAKPEEWNADYYIDKPMDIIDWLQRLD